MADIPDPSGELTEGEDWERIDGDRIVFVTYTNAQEYLWSINEGDILHIWNVRNMPSIYADVNPTWGDSAVVTADQAGTPDAESTRPVFAWVVERTLEAP